jgi:tyrosine-protein phosphatase SIW14
MAQLTVGNRFIESRARTTLAIFSFCFTIGCFGCSHAPLPPEGAVTTSGRVLATPAPELGIDHAAKLAPGVYRGGQPTNADLVTLRDQGFRTVVNLRSQHSERHQVEALGMKAIEIPMRADIVCEAPSEAAVFKFLDTVLDPANQPVFIHCAHGCDRTGVMSAVYRMEVDHWSPEEALQEMRAFGCTEYYGDLIRYVENYRQSGRYGSRMQTPSLTLTRAGLND